MSVVSLLVGLATWGVAAWSVSYLSGMSFPSALGTVIFAQLTNLALIKSEEDAEGLDASDEPPRLL